VEKLEVGLWVVSEAGFEFAEYLGFDFSYRLWEDNGRTGRTCESEIWPGIIAVGSEYMYEERMRAKEGYRGWRPDSNNGGLSVRRVLLLDYLLLALCILII
jgi:hypothetical protein